ncbi:disulfide bond formation protein B [Pontixanthobacter sp.]|uniref:disulfide bond formation protein B n=1 Tax=Pontixanthobacter sp. TaxID=2792078 RepID=UPI003C7BC4BC
MAFAPTVKTAQSLAIAVPALLLGGAYVSELIFGLYPCEMCWWQRWPHFAALAFALSSIATPFRRMMTGLAAVAILASGAIGGFHAGVEYGWWDGITSCAIIAAAAGGNALESVMNAPMVRCDAAPWDLFGISLAGWNCVISTGSAIAISVILMKPDVSRV